MLRRLMPSVIILLCVLADTSVIPVFYHGVLTVPLTMVAAMCISLAHGRMFGLLYGMIGGLLIDVTTGTLGILTFAFMTTGFLIGMALNEENARPRERGRRWLRRAVAAFLLYLAVDLVFLVYRYFVTNSFELFYLRGCLLRSLMTAILTMLFCPVTERLLLGRNGRDQGRGREVRHY